MSGFFGACSRVFKPLHFACAVFALTLANLAMAADLSNCESLAITGAVLKTVDVAGTTKPAMQLDASGSVVTYTYDKNGRNASTKYGDGSVDRWKYEGEKATRMRTLSDGTTVVCAD